MPVSDGALKEKENPPDTFRQVQRHQTVLHGFGQIHPVAGQRISRPASARNHGKQPILLLRIAPALRKNGAVLDRTADIHVFLRQRAFAERRMRRQRAVGIAGRKAFVV